MKLRMETGNFNIVLDENNQCYLPKGLTAEDFIGAIFKFTPSETNEVEKFGVVSEATYMDEGTTKYIVLKVNGTPYIYTPDTGRVSG